MIKKRYWIASLLAAAICAEPAILLPIAQPARAQTENLQQEAQRLLERGAQQTEQGQSEEAIATLQQALAVGRQINDKAIEASALLLIGRSYYSIGRPQQSLDYYNQMLAVKRIKDSFGEVIILNNIGAVYRSISQAQEALKHFNQALLLLRQAKSARLKANGANNSVAIYMEAITLNNIGAVYNSIGQPQEALKYYGQALPIQRDTGSRKGEATTLNNIGAVYQSMSQPQEALRYFNQALPIRREVDDAIGEATTLHNIGAVYRNMSQPQEALRYFNQALEIHQKLDNRSGEGVTLTSIGEVYTSIYQLQQALKYYNQALPIRQEISDARGEAVALNNIGQIYEKISQPLEALKSYQEALQIRRQVEDRAGEAITLTNIGAVYAGISQPQDALQYFNQALSIAREVGYSAGEAKVLSNIGYVYDSISQPQEALKYYNQSLRIMRQVGDIAGEAVTLSNIAAVYRDTARPTEAIANWEQAVTITLEIRGGLERQNRQAFLQGGQGPAVALVDLLIDEKKPYRAFEWANLATTADLIDYSRLIDAKVDNPGAQAEIEQWNQTNRQLELLQRRLQDEFSEQLSRKVQDLQAQANLQAEEIARQFPEVAELFETKPEDIARLQASLPPGTVAIQPVLLTNIDNVANTIAIFVITREQLTATKIEIDPTKFDTLLKQYREQLSDRHKAGYRHTGGELYELLIRPVAEQIEAASPSQLSIVATGKLRSIPFETLYDRETKQYLIQKYPVNYLTRISSRTSVGNIYIKLLSEIIIATALVAGFGFWGLRKLGSQRGSVLVLVSGVVVVGVAAVGLQTDRARLLGMGNPEPSEPFALEGAEREVQNIADILPGSETYIRDLATLETFKDQAPRFSMLHLATHGCFDPAGCCLREEGCDDTETTDMPPNTILFADRQFYNIADAALLGLKDTELIVLSACQTARVPDASNIEISGLAYILERAGASSVMATLWNVDDAATEKMMVNFYQNLQQGTSKGQALRQAKLALIDKYPHPWFWSPFVLIGDAN